MTSIVVLQARTASTRLPAKVLLPVAGMPLVVLAAKRAGNTGRKVVVATSSEPDDDELVATLVKYDLPYFRGSLHNTLERMVNAVAGHKDDEILIRLTADNVFPDGSLIDEVEAEFLSRSLEYLCCNGVASGLPYGMSIEITRVKHLRDAATAAVDAYDQEHVTPYIVRRFGEHYFDKYKHLGKGHYRCTVDDFEDYINVCKVFSEVADPIFVSGLQLICQLEKCRYQPLGVVPVTDLVVGTAQFGMNYGIANSDGQPAVTEAELMLKTAIGNGVEYIDTARAYGASEDVIGRCLSAGWGTRSKVITKLSPLEDCPDFADYKTVNAWVDASIFESCTRLKRRSLDVLMLHRAAHVTAWEGAAWKRLLQHHTDGVVKTLGVSVQTPEELVTALNTSTVSFVQMPFNILDWRWDFHQAHIEQTKRKRHLVVHARSALLQGLLSSSDKALWERAHIDNAEKIVDWLKERAEMNGCRDIADLCLRYVRSKNWIDGVVVGMEKYEQMVSNIFCFNERKFTTSQIAEIESSRPKILPSSLDPSQWK